MSMSVVLLIAVASGAAGGSGSQAGSMAAPQAKVHPSEAPYLSNIRRVTLPEMGLGAAGEAYFSPDGKSIAYQAYPEGESQYQIYTQRLSGGSPKMVSTGKGACTCISYRPDGKKIIFASTHLGGTQSEKTPDDGKYKWDFDRDMEIFEANVDGSALRRLTNTDGYDAECAYSPDGKSIVFTSQRDGDLEIYVMAADGTNPRRITRAAGYDGGPFFSPDGKTILYRADRRNDGKMNLQLRMVSATGTSDRALTDNDVFNWCPYWHPSGKSFIFTRADHEAYKRGKKPNYDLFVMSADGQRETRITFDADFDGLPVFSADGKKIMWTSKRGGLSESQIFIADFKMPDGY